MKSFLSRFQIDKSKASPAEYALLIGLIAIGAFFIFRALGPSVSHSFFTTVN